MSKQATTEPVPPPEPLVGQGALSLGAIGEVWLLWSERGLVVLGLPGREPDSLEQELLEQRLEPPPWAPVPAQYEEPLSAYAAGENVELADLPVDLRGTPFQLRVWQALRRIPRGQVRSYAFIAREVGSPRAMRAVGMANHRNPLALVIPCHRVVQADGGLGGYGSGVGLKRHLLELEGVRVDAGRVLPGQLELF